MYPPHLPPSAFYQVPVSPWGEGFACRGYFRISMPLPCPTGCSVVFQNLLVFGFLSGGFSRKGERPGRLHLLAVARPSPHYPHYLVMPTLLQFIVIKVLCVFYYVYKFNSCWRTIIRVFLQTKSNLTMWLIFTTMDVIRVKVREIISSTL